MGVFVAHHLKSTLNTTCATGVFKKGVTAPHEYRASDTAVHDAQPSLRCQEAESDCRHPVGFNTLFSVDEH